MWYFRNPPQSHCIGRVFITILWDFSNRVKKLIPCTAENYRFLAHYITVLSFTGSGLINQLHGIGFVTESTVVRLTSTQTYIFDTIQSIVGKDASENVFLLVTFADANKPPILNAVKSANMKYNKHFAFSCAGLFKDKVNSLCSDDDDGNEDDDLDKMLLKRGAKETLSFVKELNNVKPRRIFTNENGNAGGCPSAELSKSKLTEKLKLERKRSKSLSGESEASKESATENRRNIREKPKVPEKKVSLEKTMKNEEQNANGGTESAASLTSDDTITRRFVRRGSCPVSPTLDNNASTLPVRNKPIRIPELPITTRKLSFLRSQSESGFTPTSPVKATPYSRGNPSLQTPQGFKPTSPLPDKFTFAKQSKDDSGNGGTTSRKAGVSLKRQNAYSQSEDEEKKNTSLELDEILRKIEESVKVSKDKDEISRLVKEAREMTTNLRDTENKEIQKGTKSEPFSITEQVLAILRFEDDDDMVMVLNEQAAKLEKAKKNLQFLTEALSVKENGKMPAASIANGVATPKRVGSRVRDWESRSTKM